MFENALWISSYHAILKLRDVGDFANMNGQSLAVHRFNPVTALVNRMNLDLRLNETYR